MKEYSPLTLPQRYEISALHKAGQDPRCKGTSVRTQKDPFGFNALSGLDPLDPSLGLLVVALALQCGSRRLCTCFRIDT